MRLYFALLVLLAGITTAWGLPRIGETDSLLQGEQEHLQGRADDPLPAAEENDDDDTDYDDEDDEDDFEEDDEDEDDDDGDSDFDEDHHMWTREANMMDEEEEEE